MSQILKTVVYQSYKTHDVPAWIARCMDGVKNWALSSGHDYRISGDEIFDLLPGDYRARAAGRMPVLSDLARLIMARNLLAEGYERTIWIDADVLIFDPEHFHIDTKEDFAFCREIWIQPNGKGGIKVFRNVHNAVCVFNRGASFLDFYIDACQQVVGRIDAETSMVNQIVGPKLLSALHNMIGYPVMQNIGMLSPLVLQDIDRDGGPALDMLISEMPGPMQAANLCSSLAGGVIDNIDLNHTMMNRIVTALVEVRGGQLSVLPEVEAS
jgi:hypothetical protein